MKPRQGMNRPVRAPSDSEARLAWARDLSRDNTDESGVNWSKAKRIVGLPLLELVLSGGVDGIEEAERAARRRMVA